MYLTIQLVIDPSGIGEGGFFGGTSGAIDP